MTTTEQIVKLGEEAAQIETAIATSQAAAKTNRKKLKGHLESLSRKQLIALATQKKVLPYRLAVTETHEALVAKLIDVEGVLKPVAA